MPKATVTNEDIKKVSKKKFSMKVKLIEIAEAPKN